jgi:hypothetical protein
VSCDDQINSKVQRWLGIMDLLGDAHISSVPMFVPDHADAGLAMQYLQWGKDV